MKKIRGLIRKTALFIFAAVLSVTFTACGGKEEDDQYSQRTNKINITIFNGGYGYEWMNKIVRYYMENIDTTTYIKVIPTVMDGSEITKVSTGLATSDIYVLDGWVDPKSGMVTELTDVMNGYPTGETEHTIFEKCEDVSTYQREDDGKFYYMPWGCKYGYSFMYNKTTIDGALGADNWVLPRTTDEFFEFGDKLVEKGVYLYSGGYGDGYDYMFMGQKVWFAQAIGLEAYEKFMSGYYDNNRSWEFAAASPLMLEKNKGALKSFYEIIRKLAQPGTGYTHANSNAMNFTDIEAVFAGYGFGRNKARTAFIFEGPWGQNEVEQVCNVIGKEFTDVTGSMKMPVNSYIINRLPSVNNDITLRAVIDYVDGKSTEKPVGVSNDDIEAVAEARSFIGNEYTCRIMIPTSSSVIDNSKAFLRFLASDKAQEICMDELNGISVLPFDKCAEVTSTKDISNFAKECRQNAKNANYILQSNVPYKFAFVTGFNCFFGSYQIANAIFAKEDTRSSEQFYSDTYSSYNYRWAGMVEAYNNYIGN